MNFLKAGMHKLPEYMQLRQAVESNALPAWLPVWIAMIVLGKE